jgi:eukaryotic-like serine/threonine-protein kinase
VELHLGYPDRAEADAARALSLLQASTQLEAFSSTLGRAYLTLGRALQSQGKLSEARPAFHSAAKHLQNTLGPDHPDTRDALLLAESAPVDSLAPVAITSPSLSSFPFRFLYPK